MGGRRSVIAMTSSPTPIRSVTLEVADTAAAQDFYATAIGPDERIRFAEATPATDGFRGFVLSLVVAEPAVVDSFYDAAIAAGAQSTKPAQKSLWGYGGAFRAPDGTVWTIASSSKKNTGAPLRVIDDLVLQLGVDDVAATKNFYTDHGLSVAKSFGRKYVEFESSPGSVKLALSGRKLAAKNAGVAHEGGGAHRLRIDGAIGRATDPNGFAWS